MQNDKYNEYKQEQEGFLADDAYEEYDDGVDLSGDPMAEPERRKGWFARRQERKERERVEAKQRERETLKAEILAEIRAEREADRQAGEVAAEADSFAEGEDPAAQEQPRKKSKFSSHLMSILSGNILSKAEVRKVYPYLLLLVFLMFLYIGNVFRMQQLHRSHSRLTKEVDELRAKSMTIASQKMNATRQSNIITEIERRGIPLEESLAPNKVISKQ